jgi:hypothetical protein
MREVAICTLCLLLLGTGCYLGDRVAPSRTVTLRFAEQPGMVTPVLSTNDIRFREAMQAIDAVLTTNGFVQDTNPLSSGGASWVASYTKVSPNGLRTMGGPIVYLRSNQVDVVVVDSGNRNVNISPATKKVCESLRSALVARYGKNKVTVQR